MESLSTNWKRRGLLFTTACSTILIFLSCSFKSSNSPDLSCIKPRYFDQQKWIADSTGADGYRSSMIQKIESDSSFIGRSQFYINCVFSSDYDLHRKIGKIYVISVLLSAISGLYIGYFATGGVIAKSGFMTMAIAWFFTTLFAFTTIKKGKIIKHQKLMIYSYAICFSAVTLRIYLPIFIPIFGGFIPAYKLIAWLCWVPNIIVAYFIIKYQFKKTI